MTDSFIPSSSFLAKVEFDDVQRIMSVTFKNGSQTRYMYVYKPTFDAWKLAPSHGSHFSKNIKGKLLSIALVKHNIGLKKSNALHKVKIERGLNHGHRKSGPTRSGLNFGLERILKHAGLIPASLRHKGGASSNKGIAK